jgi:hypothetical protein
MMATGIISICLQLIGHLIIWRVVARCEWRGMVGARARFHAGLWRITVDGWLPRVHRRH